MAQVERDRPCIHVCLVGGADEELYRWVEIGAEEEGVPVRRTAVQASEPVLAAFEAAQGSRFDVGVSVTPGRVILHERHMPAEQPVLSLVPPDGRQCRSYGSAAALTFCRRRCDTGTGSKAAAARPILPVCGSAAGNRAGC